jgi:hypothetical protein
MKTEDYNQLKKLCDDNGFELVTQSPFENGKYFVVKKKPERVKVEFDGFGLTNDGFKAYWIIANFENVKDKDDLFDFLTNQLEEYLNDKQK